MECSYGLSGPSLYRTIKKFLVSVGIDISDCRGEGYDGAGVAAGKSEGLSAHVLRVNLKALYTHCCYHRLNLRVVASCGEQIVQNLMNNIKEISFFFLICRFHVKNALKAKCCCIVRNWYNKAKKLAEKVDISEANMTKPRTCSQQMYRSNQPVQNTKHFCVCLNIPFLDHVSADLEYRVPGDELTQYRDLYIIPYVMLNKSSDWKKNYGFC